MRMVVVSCDEDQEFLFVMLFIFQILIYSTWNKILLYFTKTRKYLH